jgi:hypothetical protein
VSLAQGNAFFLEELIRAVAEGRADALPETVLAMVEARRNKVISDIEGRRVDLAWQLRRSSDNLIEGEFQSTGARASAA